MSSPTSRSFNSRKGATWVTCARSFSGEAGTDESATNGAMCKPGSRLRASRFGGQALVVTVFVRGARQEVEEGIETSVECAAQLRNRPIDGVKRQPCLGSALEFQSPFFRSRQRSFRNEPETVDQRVARHDATILATRWARLRRPWFRLTTSVRPQHAL